MQYEAIGIETIEKINQLTNENIALKKKQQDAIRYIRKAMILKKVDIKVVLIAIKSILEA